MGRYKQTNFLLSDKEHRDLKRKCRKENIGMGQYIRRAIGIEK